MMPITKEKEEVVSTLNILLETCRGGQQGYLSAAGGTRDTELKMLFKTYSRQRAEFAGQLQDELVRLGGRPAEKKAPRDLAGDHAWDDMKSAAGDESAVIAGCEKGEDRTVKTYEEALASDLPGELETMIRHQYIQVKESYELMRMLERATR
jgi:uncharacterized protein (TIGR02284 family)